MQIMHDICVIINIFMKGGGDMVDFYTFLVVSGLKKFKDVLSFLKPKVKDRLEELGHPELATEEEPKGNA